MSLGIKLAIFAALGIGFMLLRTLGTISSKQAHELVGGGALLLDVRTPAEYKSGHVDHAVNIPVQELAGRLAELGDKHRQIVVYCRSGGRSRSAKRLLAGAGFTAVADLGAMSRW